MKNNLWKKFLAGLSAAAILVTSLGVMPIATATETAEITETKIIEKITFDGLGESVTSEITYDLTKTQTGARSAIFNTDGHRLDAKTAFRGQANVSVDDPIATAAASGTAKKFFYGGTVTANLPERETGNRYFGGANLAYKAVTFVDTNDDGTVDTRQEAEETSTSPSIAFSIDRNSNGNANYDVKLTGKGQIVYEVTVNPSKKFSLSPRTNSNIGTDGQAGYLKGGLYNVLNVANNGNITLNNPAGTSVSALATVKVPGAADAWYDLKLVYTKESDSAAETVQLYINDVLYVNKATSVNLHSVDNSRYDFDGNFDNFAITKYDGIKYDPAKAESIAHTDVIGPITFDDWEAKDYKNENKGNLNANANQIFYDSDGDATITVTEENGDKYAAFSIGGANAIWYQGTQNANINSTNYTGVSVGDQLVVSAEVHSGKTATFDGVLYVNNNGLFSTYSPAPTIGTSNRSWHRFMYVSGGKLYVGNGYDHNNNKTNYATLSTVTLPANQWVGVDLVYTIGSNVNTDPDKVDVYVNGALMDSKNLACSDVVAGKIARLEYNGTFDNYSYKTYKNGLRFNPKDATKVPYVLTVRDTLTFDGSAYAALKGTTHTNSSSTTWNDFSIKDTSIEIVEDAEGDYSLDFAYKNSTDKANFQTFTNNTGLFEGEKMQISMDIHTGSDAYFTPLVRQEYNNNTSADRYYLNNLFNIKSGVLTHNNGGNAGGFQGTRDIASAFTYVLPYDQWVNLNLVYTKKAVGMDVDMYVNGYLVKSAELAYNYLLNGPLARVELDDAHFDNLCIKTYHGGAEFDPDTLTKTESAPGLVVAPKATFDDIAGGTTGTSLKSNGVTVTSANASTVTASTGYGKATTDNYIVPGKPELQLTSTSNSRLANTIGANGLENGQQMVINLQVLPTANAYIMYRTDGTRYVDANSGTVNNYNRLLYVAKGENFGKLQISNSESNGDDKDEVSEENLAEIAIPNDRWSTVTLVYTAGDAAITTAGKAESADGTGDGVAEVVTATKNDTVTAYVNGKLALAETELAENNLFRKYTRLDFAAGGNFDNIEVVFYENGDFAFESSLSDEEYTATIPGYDGYKIFLQDKTLQELDAAITAKEGVTATYLTSAGTVVDAESGSAADVDFVSITDVDGKDYIINVATPTELPATQFEYKNAENTDNTWNYAPHAYANYALIPEENGLYGKAADDGAKHLVKDSVPEEATYDFVDKRFYLMNTASLSPGGESVFNAVPVYISFDILSTGATTGGNMTILGRVVDETGGNNGGSTIFQMNQSAIYGTAIAPKEWHNVAVQYIPGATVFSVYVDGVKLADQTLATNKTFCGFGNMFMDLSFDAYIDNLSIKTGIYTPAAPADVELAVAENANFGRGNVWDGSKLVTNKSALAYTADIAAAFSSEGNTVVLLDANGAVATEGGTIDQIAIRDANGYISYWKVAKRTTTGLTSEGEGNYILDVADNSGYNANDVVMFVVTYDNANNTIESVSVINPTSAAGDTFFFDDVTFDEDTQEMFIFHNGTLAPLK